MKVRIEDATAKQLRAYLLAAHKIETAPNATVKSLKNKLATLGFDGTEFELSDADLAAFDADSPKPAFMPDDAVAAMVAGGMDEEDARNIVRMAAEGHEAKQRAAKRVAGEKVYGLGKEHLFATIRINPGEGKEGAFPVFVRGPHGRKDIPRGIDWPVSTQVVEALDHAVRTEYDEVLIAEHLPRIFVPRQVKRYPFAVVDGPYDEEEYRRQSEIAASARAAQLGPTPGMVRSPETAHLADLALTRSMTAAV